MKLFRFLIQLGIVFLVFSCGKKEKNVPCDIPPTVTYKTNIAPIIEQECFECHAKEVYKKKASRNKIYDYKSLKKMAQEGMLLGALNHEPGFIAMPYKKGKKIDACKIKIISAWVSSGMKE